jgi:nucleoside-diphosphate-sugar epimerase
MPVWKAKLLAHVGIAGLLGFNWDQVVMSQEDSTTDISKFTHDFGWQPQGFEQALKEYASQM